MDPYPLGDLSVIGSASSQFAGLDLNGKVVHSMETDFLPEVPDTPDRMVARHKEGNVVRKNVSASLSMGHQRRDGFHRWHRNPKFESRGSNSFTSDCDSSDRREKWGTLTSRSLETRDHPSIQRETTKPKHDLRDSISIHGEARVSGENEHEKGGRLVDMRSRMAASSSCTTNMNGMSDMGNDVNKHDGLNSIREVIHLGSSPQLRPIRRMVNGVASKLSDHSTEVDKSIATGQGVDLTCDSQIKRVQYESGTLKFDGPSKTTDHRMLMRNRYISPCSTMEKGVNIDPQVGEKGSLSNDGISRDKGKEIELSAGSKPSDKGSFSSSPEAGACPRITRQRRLVRNGCISPANIVRNDVLIDEVKEVNNMNLSTANSQANSLRQMNNSSLRVEGHCPGKEKGKNILDEHCMRNGQEFRARSSRNRLGTMQSKNNSTVGDTREDISLSVGEPGWITTGNRKGLSNGVTMIVDEVGDLPRRVHEGNVDEGGLANIMDGIDSFEFVPPHIRGSTSNPVWISSNVSHGSENSSHQGKRLMKGKRKNRSGRIFLGETSTKETSTLFSPLSGQPSNILSRGTSNKEGHNVLLRSIIDVDELASPESSQPYPNNGNSSVNDSHCERALQVESDELLAHQLQEQLFNESPGPETLQEIDASIAWSLQQEEDAHSISSIRGRCRSQSRDPSMAHLYIHYPRHSSRNSSGQLPRQPRSMPRISQLRRNLNRHHMDLESRLNYLEALEAAFDGNNAMALPDSLLHLERDFNENDYEMLLALDNENHNHAGASCRQINSLPLSVVQTNNLEEACAICLDAPSIGDKIRHLPCLHKFHKDCIDTWLRRKTSCPVCKSGIT